MSRIFGGTASVEGEADGQCLFHKSCPNITHVVLVHDMGSDLP